MLRASLKTIAIVTFFLTTVESSIAQNQEVDLVGTWNLNVGYFNVQGGDCTINRLTTDPGAFNGQVRIDRSGSNYGIDINQPAIVSVSGDQMSFNENSGGGTLSWIGTINKISNSQTPITVISGVETCNNQATLPFTMIRLD